MLATGEYAFHKATLTAYVNSSHRVHGLGLLEEKTSCIQASGVYY